MLFIDCFHTNNYLFCFMRKILFYFVCILFLISCDNGINEYQRNLAQVQKIIDDINFYFMDSTQIDLNISSYYTEDFLFHTYPVHHKKGLTIDKQAYIDNLFSIKEKNLKFNIGHVISLPGIDEKSYTIDGSVRIYYGATIFTDTNHVEYSGYQTINFRDGKLSEAWEWADYTGIKYMLNQIN